MEYLLAISEHLVSPIFIAIVENVEDWVPTSEVKNGLDDYMIQHFYGGGPLDEDSSKEHLNSCKEMFILRSLLKMFRLCYMKREQADSTSNVMS